jgi:hypothetical protein
MVPIRAATSRRAGTTRERLFNAFIFPPYTGSPVAFKAGKEKIFLKPLTKQANLMYITKRL